MKAVAAPATSEQRRDALAGWSLQYSQMLGRLPELAGVALASRHVAAAAAGAGGDWYDAIPLPDGRVALAMGDVAGHGRHAASAMTILRNALRAYALDGESPAVTVGKLERFVLSLEPGTIAAVLYAVFDREGGVVRVVRAGHPAPLLLPPDGEPRFLDASPGAPLGSTAGAAGAEYEITLTAGTTLLLYSNGLVGKPDERPARARERLCRVAAEGARDPEPLVARLIGELLGAGPVIDDVALLALQVAPRAGAELHLTVRAVPEELAEVRHALRRWLAGRGASDREVAAMTLACQEACANAVEHAYGLPDATFELIGHHVDGRVELLVRDQGQWRPPRGVNRGRGLAIMRSLMHEVDVVAGDNGTTVRLAHRLGAIA
jgi:anti-sigma regulatory factor (Ser/Thr protein kinase)